SLDDHELPPAPRAAGYVAPGPNEDGDVCLIDGLIRKGGHAAVDATQREPDWLGRHCGLKNLIDDGLSHRCHSSSVRGWCAAVMVDATLGLVAPGSAVSRKMASISSSVTCLVSFSPPKRSKKRPRWAMRARLASRSSSFGLIGVICS